MTNKKHQNQKFTTQNLAIILICIVVPVIIGIASHDPIVGTTMLASGLLSSYLASLQKKTGYIFGFINALLIAYVGFENNLFGTFAVNTFIFAPLEIVGFLSWNRHQDKKKNVKIRKLTRQNSILITASCVIGSIILGYLLTKIPTQQMAFLDSTICCIDICALIMMNLRYEESWWLWVVSGILSIVMWAIALAGGGDNTFMRLLAAIGFLIINTYGAIRWYKKLK